jgi:hypothetical protein
MSEEVKDEAPKKEEESWMQKKWRPLMAMMYMCVCASDFIVFPIMFTVVQFWETQAVNDAFRQWAPLTLQGGGLFHMAMGAVLGITAWSRGQEKMAGVSSGPTPSQPIATPMAAPQSNPMPQVNAYSPPPAPAQPQVTTGYGGKLAPPPAEHPPI